MGFWTIGPVLGSLAVSAVNTLTLRIYQTWQSQFYCFKELADTQKFMEKFDGEKFNPIDAAAVPIGRGGRKFSIRFAACSNNAATIMQSCRSALRG